MYVCTYRSMYVYIYVYVYNLLCVSSCIYQEEKLLKAAKEGRVDEVVALLDQGVDIQCTDLVSNIHNISRLLVLSIIFV